MEKWGGAVILGLVITVVLIAIYEVIQWRLRKRRSASPPRVRSAMFEDKRARVPGRRVRVQLPYSAPGQPTFPPSLNHLVAKKKDQKSS